MKLISTVQTPVVKSSASFPKLMVSDQLVVLFQARGEGVVVVSDDYHSVGTYMKCWNAKQFSDFYGTVTITSADA